MEQVRMSSKRVINLSVLGSLAIAGFSAIFCGCAEQQKPPRIEDKARQMAPIPACIMRLPPSRGDKAFVRNLRWDQYWELVFPDFDTEKKALPQGAIPCTGRPVFNDPLFNGGDSPKGWPRPVDDEDILFGSGGDRLKIIWMRTHRWSDETEAGPLALVRTQDDYAEVYAIGAYRGRTKKPYFALERMGGEALVTAQDDLCTGNPAGPCENTLTVFIPRGGQLRALTVLSLEQRAFALGGEPGTVGRVEYRLTTSPTFTKDGIKVLEQVKAQDESGRVLRKAELERVFKLQESELVPNEEALWPRIYPKQAAR
jgi:hypothetical protein